PGHPAAGQGGVADLPTVRARGGRRPATGRRPPHVLCCATPERTRPLMSDQGITQNVTYEGAAYQGPTEDLREGDPEAVRRLKDAFANIKQQLSRIIVGQEQVIEELLISLFSKGHCILEGVPGLAKTLMISTLSRSLSLAFSRIQFTPDL